MKQTDDLFMSSSSDEEGGVKIEDVVTLDDVVGDSGSEGLPSLCSVSASSSSTDPDDDSDPEIVSGEEKETAIYAEDPPPPPLESTKESASIDVSEPEAKEYEQWEKGKQLKAGAMTPAPEGKPSRDSVGQSTSTPSRAVENAPPREPSLGTPKTSVLPTVAAADVMT